MSSRISRGREIAEPERGVLLEHPFARFERGPDDRDARAADATPEEDPHVHVGTALEANRLERHAHLGGVALSVPAPGAVPYVVGRLVFTARHGVQHVELHTVGVDHQVIGELPGAERVEADAYPVVGPDVVAAGDGGLDGGRVGIVALEREIKVVAVVPDPDLCFLRDRRTVERVVRQPLTRLERSLAPCVVVEHTVDGWRLRHAMGAQRRFDRRGLGRLSVRGLRARQHGRGGHERQNGKNRESHSAKKGRRPETHAHRPLDGAACGTVAGFFALDLKVMELSRPRLIPSRLQSFSAISTLRASSSSAFFSLVSVGYFRFRSLRVWYVMAATARRMNHLLSAGMMYQGAFFVLV